jgi:predicted PolB exonuclease-like 3'-5' exonuclease
MFDISINKLLFFDLETAGVEKDYTTLLEKNPELARLFESYRNWFEKRYPEDEGKSLDELFINHAALVSDFARIVVATFAFITPKNEIHVTTFADKDEKKILKEVKNLFTKIEKMDFHLCGHNIKGFDMPMLSKRFIVNGMKPPSILPKLGTKPWELKAVDTKEFWQFGSFNSPASLDLMCVTLGVESPKTGEVSGNLVHEYFWEKEGLDEIAKYCERDVNVLVELIKKLYELK